MAAPAINQRRLSVASYLRSEFFSGLQALHPFRDSRLSVFCTCSHIGLTVATVWLFCCSCSRNKAASRAGYSSRLSRSRAML